MTSIYQGFVLQASYRIQQGKPVVYIFGRLQDGRTFIVRDHQQRPHFYVRQSDARHVVRARVLQSERVNFAGESLVRVEVDTPQQAPPLRDALHGMQVPTYEADVRFAMRYLIDRNIRGGIAIRGEPQHGLGTDLVFDDPETQPAEVQISPRVLSFDIETNPQTDRLLAIACYGCGVDEVVVVDPGSRPMPAHAIGVATEQAALAHFSERVRQLDPDVLTGWNVIDFDLSFLARVAERHRYNLQLGREPGAMRIRPAQGYFGSGHVSIPGRVVLDGIDLLRGAFVKLDDFSLEGVAQVVLGEGKTLSGRGREKVAQILDTYAHDLPSFAAYARTDARLVIDIIDKLDVMALAFVRSALTGMPPDRVAASIASFDFLYLSALQGRGVAAPSVQQSARGGEPQGGGAVFEPRVGIHAFVWVFDFKSLYPSIIRTFNIDPLGYHQALQNPGSHVYTHDGTAFVSASPDQTVEVGDLADAGELSILPDMLDRLFPQRDEAKARGDAVASQAIKILMNSFYGVLGTPACRFYNPAIANAITSQGRHLLGWSKQWFEERGYAVLYGDTDSVFVASGCSTGEQAMSLAPGLVADFNAGLADYLQTRYGVVSRLQMEFEKLYSKLFLASVRGGSQGARKRYAGLRYTPETPETPETRTSPDAQVADSQALEFVGMEVVRRDWTELAKQVQKNLFARLFHGDEVAQYLHSVVAQLRAGELDDLLVYHKGLRKPVDSYTTNIPPHVQAVKKSSVEPPRLVAYVITEQGPELAAEQRHPLDREHYLQRQVQPVAEPVLEALGLNFNQVIGDDRQIDLFG